MNLRLLGGFLGLSALLGITYWLSDSASVTPQTQVDLAEQDHSIDFYMESYDAIIMDKQGKPVQRITSPRLTHYADDDTTELEQPDITVHRKIGSAWQIKSERGWVAADNKLVLLTGNVRIDRDKSAANPAMKLRTERLRVLPDDDYVESDKAVYMETDRQKVHANGMRAYLAKNQVQLLNKVTSHYD